MSESRLPEITLTSPSSSSMRRPGRALAYSPARSPERSDGDGRSGARSRQPRRSQSRPTTPSPAPAVASPPSRGRDARPESSSSWTSPVRLIRSRSSHVQGQANGNGNVNGNGNGNGNTPRGENVVETPASPMDPLSQHILDRTGSIPKGASPLPRPATSDGSAEPDNRASNDFPRGSAPAVQPPSRRSTDISLESSHPKQDLRKGVKAVAFISKLITGSSGSNKKKGDDDDEQAEEETVSNEDRPEGNDAQVFTEQVTTPGGSMGGYSPRNSQPPAYIKVRSKYKKQRDFDHLFLAQELEGRVRRHEPKTTSSSNKLRRKSTIEPDAPTVWAMQFSRDGRYLAAAGVDGIVRVWAVLSSPEDRQKHEKQERNDYFDASSNGGGSGGGSDVQQQQQRQHLCSPVFQSQPIREYEGHTATVLDLSWSKNNFLLSSSMDKTVRLWHVSRSECLCTFKHNDIVPSTAFHPKDDRFFLAGSLDSKLRLWSIPDKSVAYVANVPDMITAVAFTPDGKCSIAGCLSGLCMFFETEGLKYQSQIHVRSTRGQNSKGSKITGVQPYYDATGESKLLITSNDSRTRLYNFRDKNLEMKFRGNVNNSSQIRASISDDGRFVICGSEDRRAHIWSTGLQDGERRDRRPCEMFEAHDTIATAACFAPAKTRQHLARSRDPVYDLCTPPSPSPAIPVELADSRTSSKPATENESLQGTPVSAEATFEHAGVAPPATPKQLSPTSRTNHRDGAIIVTADYAGKIKVFRQDCAWSKRRNDDWDRASLFSTKRTVGSGNMGKVSRQGSSATIASLRSNVNTSGAHSDRIMSWRQGVVSTSNVADSTSSQRHPPSSTAASRSISPQQRASLSSSKPRSIADRSNKPSSLRSQPIAVDTNPSTNSERHSPPDQTPSTVATTPATAENISPSSPRAVQGHSRTSLDENPLLIAGGRSYAFWNADEWVARAERMRHTSHVAECDPLSTTLTREEDASRHNSILPVPSPNGGEDTTHLSPNTSNSRPNIGPRGETFVSQLSDEKSSAEEHETDEEDGQAFDDAREHFDREEHCRYCGMETLHSRSPRPDGGSWGTCRVCGHTAL